MKDKKSPCQPQVELEKLVAQFYRLPQGLSQVGEFQSIPSVPEPFNELLNHHKHMTVTVEAFHGQQVEVVVHRAERSGNWYGREIGLITKKDREPVLYGLVRLNINTLPPDAWRRIESRQTPLGRVLIEHDVLCEVQLCGLWQLSAGRAIASIMRTKIGETLFGRTALIYCDGAPAIELLEVVVPTLADTKTVDAKDGKLA